MIVMAQSRLLDLVEEHLAQTGESAARFGKRVMRDPNFVLDLRNGREPRSATVKRVMNVIEHERGSRS